MAFKIPYFSKTRLVAGGFASRPPRPPAAGGSASRAPSAIRLSYINSLTHVSRFKHFHYLILVYTQITSSGLPFFKTFVPQKVPISKISDDVIAFNLWFGPSPQSKNLAVPMPPQRTPIAGKTNETKNKNAKNL